MSHALKVKNWLVALLALTAVAAHAAGEAKDPSCVFTSDQLKSISIASVASRDGPKKSTSPEVRLRQSIVLEVNNLAVLRERVRCAGPGKKLVLYLDGRPLPNLEPYPPSPPTSNLLTFELKRDEASRSVWTHLLGKPAFQPKPIPVSVGLADEYAVDSKAEILLDAIPSGWFWAWTGVLVSLGLVFGLLAHRSNMLRAAGPNPPVGYLKPFSLARVQSSFWFFLTLTSYAFIGMLTGDYGSSITGTVLALMGISAGTAIGASLIDSNRDVAAASSGSVDGLKSEGLLKDILKDGKEVNFHRFQMVAWTIVLGVIFLHEVWANLAMPEFSGTLLGLMGISSGTYLGLKTAAESK